MWRRRSSKRPRRRRKRSTRSPAVHLFALAAAALLPAAVGAQTDGPTARVDSLFARWDRPGSPGCTVGVIRDGRLVHARGYGMADLEQDAPLTSRSVFYIASTSKQFAAAAIALLAQDGVLALDHDIRRWIPELPDYGRPITVRDLVHHTSGLRDYLTLIGLAGGRWEDVRSEDDVVSIIARQRELNFEPGEAFLYTNSGYVLLSVIVRRATGRSLREFTTERIFRPLGMADTHFHDDRGMVVPRRVTSYSPAGDAGYRIQPMLNFELVGDGGLLTTLEDLARWDANFYGPDVGGEALIERILSRGVLNDGDTLPYAFGLRHETYRGLPAVSHGGAMAGFRTEMIRFPEERFTVVCLCNRADANAGALARRVADIYLADRLGPVTRTASATGAGAGAAGAAARRAIRVTSADLRAYTGRYHSEELGTDYSFALMGDSLVLRRYRAPDQALRPQARDAFTAGPLTIEFVRDAEGRPSGFRLGAGRVRNLRFVRVDD